MNIIELQISLNKIIIDLQFLGNIELTLGSFTDLFALKN